MPMMPGVAPPMSGAPTRTLGGAGGRSRAAGLIEATRIILGETEKLPEVAKDLHAVADQLTKIIRKLVEPSTPNGPDGASLPDGPALDTSPLNGGEETGNPAALLSKMLPPVG